jgi:outer membrane protein assembly factor BamB
MRTLIITTGLAILCCISCSCTSPTGYTEQLLWQQSISSGKLIDGELPTTFYKGQVIALGNQFSTSKPAAYCFDAATGNRRWIWSDWFLDNGSVLTDRIYISDNAIVVSNDALTYGIDAQSGMTLWRNRNSRSVSGTLVVNGIGQIYFFGAYFSDGTGQMLKGNTNSGKEEVIISFPKATGPYYFTPFIAANQDTMLIVTSVYGEAATNFYNKVYLTLFNVSQNKEIYTLLQREGPSTQNNLPMGVPVIINDQVFTAIGFGIQANDVLTGKLLWRTATPRPFTEGGVISGDELLYANDDDGFLYGFDKKNGTILWKTKTAGSVTGLFFMNGVVYLVGGDGNLYAVDGKTGAIIWKMRSPDDDGRSQSFFTGKVAGANGRIYVRSFLNLYCYKAAR